MSLKTTMGGVAALSLLAAATLANPASADAVAEFYKGKTVIIIVAAGPGGNHTKYSRFMATYLQKYMPGHPNFVIQNMGGAGGTKAANFLYNSAPKDGTRISILLSDTALASRLRTTGVKYKANEFQYLGGADRTQTAFVIMKSAGIRTFADAMKKQVIMGSTGKGSQTYTVPTIVNALFGTKFKTILGYRGMGGIYLALERGEVEGFSSVWASIHSLRPQWIKEKTIDVIAAVSLDKLPDRPDVPLLQDMTNDPMKKKIIRLIAGNGVLGRAWLAPPKVPADRIAALRMAFSKALADPDARAETAKRRMTWNPVPWQDLQNQVKAIVAADDSVIQRMRAAIKTGGKARRKK
jgi:tripartite-type tricarboxylate transporter receptor subunit TctC